MPYVRIPGQRVDVPVILPPVLPIQYVPDTVSLVAFQPAMSTLRLVIFSISFLTVAPKVVCRPFRRPLLRLYPFAKGFANRRHYYYYFHYQHPRRP